MKETSLLIQLSAFSGLMGALLSQLLTGLFAYFGDKRKARQELKAALRNKQMDIAENFYFVNGEKMAVVRKNIGFWKDWNTSRSEATLAFLTAEMKKLNAYMEKLELENWKFNLIGLYFDVSLNYEETIRSNDRSKQLYIDSLDIVEQLSHALPDEKDDLYQLYDASLRAICAHYEETYEKMSADMDIVKRNLLKELVV